MALELYTLESTTHVARVVKELIHEFEVARYIKVSNKRIVLVSITIRRAWILLGLALGTSIFTRRHAHVVRILPLKIHHYPRLWVNLWF